MAVINSSFGSTLSASEQVTMAVPAPAKRTYIDTRQAPGKSEQI
jgi:hypothetical protein